MPKTLCLHPGWTHTGSALIQKTLSMNHLAFGGFEFRRGPAWMDWLDGREMQPLTIISDDALLDSLVEPSSQLNTRLQTYVDAGLRLKVVIVVRDIATFTRSVHRESIKATGESVRYSDFVSGFVDRLEQLYTVDRFYQSVAYRFPAIDIRFLSHGLIEHGERAFLSSFNVACGSPMKRTFNVPREEVMSNDCILKLVKVRALFGDLNRAYLRNLDKSFIERVHYQRKFDEQVSVVNRLIDRVASIEKVASKVLEDFPLEVSREEANNIFDYDRLDPGLRDLMGVITKRNATFMETAAAE